MAPIGHPGTSAHGRYQGESGRGRIGQNDANDPSDIGSISCCSSEAGSALSKYSFEPIRCLLLSLGARMRRREFLGVLGGAAAAWPLAARAQQPERVRRIGVLMASAADDPEARPASAAFLQGLQQLGWTDGRNVRIDTRWAAGQCRRHSQTRGGIGRARARCHPGHWRLDRGAVAAGDPHRADRVRRRPRSGRRRLRRQPGAAGRQRHRLHSSSNTA